MKENLKGGGFLTSETKANEIFILEEFNEEARMMLDATREFNEKEIKPNDKKGWQNCYSNVTFMKTPDQISYCFSPLPPHPPPPNFNGVI